MEQSTTRRPRIAVLRSSTDLALNRTGGARYQAMVVEALRKAYDVDVHYVYSRYPVPGSLPARAWKFARMTAALRTRTYSADILLLDRRTMFLSRQSPSQATIGLYHHHPLNGARWKPGRLLVELSGRVGFKKVDVLVAVSGFWRDYFSRLGARDVRVIHNSFEQHAFSEAELNAFRRAHGLDMARPVLYIGMNSPEKGAVEVYERLRHRNYELVTSGPKRTDLPCLHLDLPYEDYLKLLAVSTLAVNMSRMPEGWCRTAHEAMLMRTPVVGSGRAGMAELLRGGGQVICSEPSRLDAVVAELLADPARLEALSAAGYAFASTFTVERFETAWRDLVEDLHARRFASIA